MAIKPIRFNSHMVDAILDGRKTVTRRVVKPRYKEDEGGFQVNRNVKTGERWVEKSDWDEGSFDPPRYVNPPYLPSDVLWVRETWNYGAQAGYVYRRDFSYEEECAYGTENEKGELVPMPWRPSIHMPREAARIWLRVTNVRVERLQTIDEAGAEAEGGQALIWNGKPVRTARDDFAIAWDNTINPTDCNRYGWKANPWVWVIEFERCEKPTCAVSS